MAESLLHALEQSLRAFEKHRELVLDQLKRRPKRPDPSLNLGGPDLATTPHILKNGPWKGRKLYDLYKATEPPREWFPELLLHARKIGITIFSSVFSPEDVDFLEQFNP